MMCDECGKRPANFHLTKMINGHKTEYHLCEECAGARGDWGFPAESSFSVHQLLSSLLNYSGPEADPPASRIGIVTPTCRECGLTYDEFAQSGRLGCGRCYEEFGSHMESLLRRVHGAGEHRGKSPARGAGKSPRVVQGSEIDRVRAELQKAVEREDFETAAKLRDKIRQLEKRESVRRQTETGKVEKKDDGKEGPVGDD